MIHFLTVFFLICSTNVFGASWNKLSLEDLRSIDVAELSDKDARKVYKAKQKAVKRCEKTNVRNEKKHDKAERKRISELNKKDGVRIFSETKVRQGEFDSGQQARSYPVTFPYEVFGRGNNYSFTLNDSRNYPQSQNLERGPKVLIRSRSKYDHELYIRTKYISDGMYIDTANLQGGTTKPVSRHLFDVDCSGGSCFFSEELGVPFSSSELNEIYISKTDLRLRLHGSSTGMGYIATIPNDLVKWYVNKVNSSFPITDSQNVEKQVAALELDLEHKSFVGQGCN